MFTQPKITFLNSSDTKNNFGIYKLSAQESSPKFNMIEYVLNIDRSGSTMDMCPDGKTKMEHMHFTIKNMVDYFMKLKKEEKIKQYITIIIFDHHPEIMCERNEINDTFKKNLPKLLATIYPRGSTNIEKALDLANITINKIKKIYSNNPTNNNDYGYYDDEQEISNIYNNKVQISHIFMSDGHITVGSNNKDNLKNILKDSNCVNTFIGYGVDHDSSLMKTLGDIKKGEYYFIESLENAGMVYGEVLYNSLYEYLQDIHIKVTDGSIYNYKTNTWDTELHIPSLSSGRDRTWHIKTSENPETPEKFEIATYYSTVENTQHGIYQHTSDCKYPEGANINKEVEKYVWRQKTQEKLYEAEKYIKDTQENTLCKPKYTINPNFNLYHSPIAIHPPPPPEPLHMRSPATPPPSPTKLYPGALSKPHLQHNLTSIKIEKNKMEKNKEYIAKLDKFMEELKTYMKVNELEDDEFMKNLCDDIFICTKGFTSSKGEMYISTRALSQGRERAYNVRNLTELDSDDNDIIQNSNIFRSLSNHTMSEERTTAYASRGATNLMREVSGCL